MSANDWENVVHLVFEIGVAPLFLALFYLYNAVKRIEIMLNAKFVTKDELHREIDNVKDFQNFHKTLELGQTHNPH